VAVTFVFFFLYYLLPLFKDFAGPLGMSIYGKE